MSVNIHNLIAAIVPDIYCDSSVKSEVKELAKKEGYLKAAEKAKPKEPAPMDLEKIEFTSPFKLSGIKNPIEKLNLTYDLSGQPGQILEELYYWILDYVNTEYGSSQKLIDNFIASPGSSLFTDVLSKKTRVQEEASRIMGNVNTVVRSILNLIYDLKEFQGIIELYDKSHSKNKTEKQSAIIALKQRWLDQVDIKRGGSSIKQLAITGANQPNFVFLIDAFMSADTLEEVDKLDLNDRLKRLVKQRLQEFLIWLKDSEQSLRKRYELEKNYLKSQVNSVKLYAHWAKPYLKAAKRLEENAQTGAEFVHAFNTALFELILLGRGKYDINYDVGRGVLPQMFSTYSGRQYHPIAIIELRFRSTPETVGQHHRFRGRLELTLTSYALTDKELETLKSEMEKDDFGDIVGAIEGATDESLKQIQVDIDEILSPKVEEKEEKREEGEDINPFTALFSFLKIGKKKKKSNEGEKPENEMEKVIRSQSLIKARADLIKLYGSIKKAYNLPAF